jgi:ATP adenylyltransferase
MERLFAPWRIRYILSEKENGCIFCDKSKSTDDAKNLVLVRDRTCFALLNTFPYTAGHLMVAPYKHTAELDDLAESELADLILLTRRCQQILRKAIQPQGFNVGLNLGRIAGAGIVDHLHFHIVPRWGGDTNFMPVLADTQMIPQALSEMYETLRQHV